MFTWARIKWLFVFVAVMLASILVLGASTLPPADETEQVRAYTRDLEFEFIGWTLNALRVKTMQLALNATAYMPDAARKELVLQYMDLVSQIQLQEARIETVYADPAVSDAYAASAQLRAGLERLKALRNRLAPLAEAILQDQVSYVVDRLDLDVGGQPFPAVLYHSTPLPLALIVSPRDEIRQRTSVALVPDLTFDQRDALESRVDSGLDVSSLVVPIGGMGVYPTMVAQTSNLEWLSEVVSHEWVHNFLTLRPLGMSYMESNELRTMNETAAEIAGKEISRAVLETFYPELVPPPAGPEQPAAPAAPSEPPAFDFRHEMYLTRQTVDRLLAEGKIEEAEAYMEMRRQVFWDNGYRIRKLNQAYFAFYGAYADRPGGAAGEDPVGAAVRQLRAQSASLAEFLNRISWLSSFEDLQEMVNSG